MSGKKKTLKAQIDSLCLALSRDATAARFHKAQNDDKALEAALKRAMKNSSEALGLHQLMMNENKKRPIDSP